MEHFVVCGLESTGRFMKSKQLKNMWLQCVKGCTWDCEYWGDMLANSIFGSFVKLHINSWFIWYAFSRWDTATSTERLFTILKSDKIKQGFFQAVAMSVLLYDCTTWILKNARRKKLKGNYTNMLLAVLNKSWKQHSTK